MDRGKILLLCGALVVAAAAVFAMVAAPPADASRWRSDPMVDPMTDQVSDRAIAESPSGTLIVLCGRDGPMRILAVGVMVPGVMVVGDPGSERDVTWRIDRNAAVTSSWIYQRGGVGLRGDAAIPVARGLRRARAFHLRATSALGDPVNAAFSFAGGGRAVDRVLDACGVPREG